MYGYDAIIIGTGPPRHGRFVSSHQVEVEGVVLGVAVRIDREDGPRELVGSHLLLATGRVPNTEDLGLEAAGVKTDTRGYIQVGGRLRTNVDGIWALGD